MTIFDERPAPPISRRRFRLLLLPAIALLGGAALFLSHRPHLQQTLREFRGETAAADSGPNYGVNDALIIRRGLLQHPHSPLPAAQVAQLNALVVRPTEEQSQSEALDVLGLAQRAHALSAAQAQDAQTATLLALSRNPAPMVRLEGARLLGHLGLSGSTPALTLLQQDADPKIRQAAGEALIRAGKSGE